MRLLVVTDHRYYQDGEGVYDAFCFDRSFFDDYRAVFDEVRVAARMASSIPPARARRSDGDGVSFVPLPDRTGLRWATAGLTGDLRGLRDAVRWADAVCVRIPSVSGNAAARLARRYRRPVMFELIGDPRQSMAAAENGFLHGLYGALDARTIRQITRSSVAGSYVSREHLQRAYPAGPQTVTESISSIRLPTESVLPPRRFSEVPAPLRTVLVAGFVGVKKHDVLVRATRLALDRGVDLRLCLVGDGPTRHNVETLAAGLGLAQAIKFVGHVSDRERLISILDASDLFVMTSASEGLPRALLEAMARGLPALGSAAGGIAELLTPNQLHPVGDVQRLAEQLVHVGRSPRILSEYAVHSGQVVRDYVAPLLSARRQRLLARLRTAAQGPIHS